MKIVIPGGSGQVGHMLARHFHAHGDTVTLLSRNPKPAPWRSISWDGATPGAWIADLEQSDVCINLSGRSVNCRYTAANRRAIYDSRIQSTRLLNQVVASLQSAPRVWLNASTATIYRHALDRPMDEATGELGGGEPGAPDTWNFSIDVAKGWEDEFFATTTPLTRKIALRSAITFGAERGGVFDVLSGLARRGLGGTQGPGTQFVSWIHETDFVRAIDLLIDRDDFSGMVQSRFSQPTPQFGIHACAARGVGRRLWIAESPMGGRNRRMADGDRVGAGSQEPPGRAWQTAGGWVPVSVRGMAFRSSRSSGTLAPELWLGACAAPRLRIYCSF